MVKINFLTFLLFFNIVNQCFSQDRLEPEVDHELAFGVNWHTMGGIIGGFNMKYAQSDKKGRMSIFGVEGVNIKHPREVRFSNDSSVTFLYRKVNRFFILRPHYGKEFILFAKGQDQGVQVGLIVAGGPSFGFLTPYKVQYASDNGSTVIIQNSTRLDPKRIRGSDGLFDRLGEAKLVPGINLKVAMNLSFTPFGGDGTGVELGLVTDIFNQKIPLVEESTPKRTFLNAFATVYYSFR